MKNGRGIELDVGPALVAVPWTCWNVGWTSACAPVVVQARHTTCGLTGPPTPAVSPPSPAWSYSLPSCRGRRDTAGQDAAATATASDINGERHEAALPDRCRRLRLRRSLTALVVVA